MDHLLFSIFVAAFGIFFWELIKYTNYRIRAERQAKAFEKSRAEIEEAARLQFPDAKISVTLGDPDSSEETWRPGEYRTITNYHDSHDRPVRKTVEVRRTDDYVPGEE